MVVVILHYSTSTRERVRAQYSAAPHGRKENRNHHHGRQQYPLYRFFTMKIRLFTEIFVHVFARATGDGIGAYLCCAYAAVIWYLVLLIITII